MPDLEQFTQFSFQEQVNDAHIRVDWDSKQLLFEIRVPDVLVSKKAAELVSRVEAAFRPRVQGAQWTVQSMCGATGPVLGYRLVNTRTGQVFVADTLKLVEGPASPEPGGQT